jgi:hypothetical protein
MIDRLGALAWVPAWTAYTTTSVAVLAAAAASDLVRALIR